MCSNGRMRTQRERGPSVWDQWETVEESKKEDEARAAERNKNNCRIEAVSAKSTYTYGRSGM